MGGTWQDQMNASLWVKMIHAKGEKVTRRKLLGWRFFSSFIGGSSDQTHPDSHNETI